MVVAWESSPRSLVLAWGLARADAASALEGARSATASLACADAKAEAGSSAAPKATTTAQVIGRRERHPPECFMIGSLLAALLAAIPA